MKNLICKHSKVLFTIFLLTLGFVFFSNSKTYAAGAIYPRSSTDAIFLNSSPNDPATGYLEVANSGGGSTLQAGLTTVYVYFTTTGTKTVTIQGGKQCGATDWQSGLPDGSYTTAFNVKDVNGHVLDGSANSGSCTNDDVTLTFDVLNNNNFIVDLGDNSSTTFYRVKVSALIVAKSYGFVNAFKVFASTPTGSVYVTLPEENGGSPEDTYFAIQRRPGAGSGNRNFAIYFAPDCTLSAPKYDYIFWYDDDWNTIEKDANFGMQLAKRPKGSTGAYVGTSISGSYSRIGTAAKASDYTATSGASLGSGVTRSINGTNYDLWHKISTKDDGSKDSGGVKYRTDPGYEYRLTFTSVSGENGIRFTLPYESIYNYINCLPPPPPITGNMNLTCSGASLSNLSLPYSGRINAVTGSTTSTRGISAVTGGVSQTIPFSSGWTGGNPDPTTNSYTVTLYAYDKNGNLQTLQTKSILQSTCYNPPPPDVTFTPYFQTFNADVVAGGAFASGDTCNVGSAPKAGILAYINPLSSHNSGGTSGSGSQLGSFASDTIKGFISSTLNSNASSHNALTAGGISSLDNTDTYAKTGDGFNQATATCVPDYYGETRMSDINQITSPGTVNNLNGYAASKQTLFNGNVTVSQSGTYANKHAFYINGDLYIDQNIIYGGYSTIAQIPSLTFIVNGNIYIAPNVTQLDGLYIAQPVDPNKGVIYTCGSAYSGYTSPGPTYSNCASGSINPLKIYGSVIAKRVVLNRGSKDISTSKYQEQFDSSNASELFIHTPELYLSPPIFNQSSGSSASKLDSIGVLAPIL